jgi:hypothetical protein
MDEGQTLLYANCDTTGWNTASTFNILERVNIMIYVGGSRPEHVGHQYASFRGCRPVPSDSTEDTGRTMVSSFLSTSIAWRNHSTVQTAPLSPSSWRRSLLTMLVSSVVSAGIHYSFIVPGRVAGITPCSAARGATGQVLVCILRRPSQFRRCICDFKLWPECIHNHLKYHNTFGAAVTPWA